MLKICFTREFRNRLGLKSFRLGCEDKLRCDTFTNGQILIGKRGITDGGRRMCYECCNSNDCNSRECATDCSSVNAHNWCFGNVDGRDCSEILKKNKSATDGIYLIDPGDEQGPFPVFCDMTTDGGGWVVFQRRLDGSEDFYRTWDEYKNGFGSLSREFYLGNEKIHRLTSTRTAELRIDLEDFQHNKVYAMYKNFVLGSVSSNYQLNIGVYSGTADDSLTWHNGCGFTTKDKDNDKDPSQCAQLYHGAWWYLTCHVSNLNGQYNNTRYGEGINWYGWKGYYYSLYHTEMKLRSSS